MSFLLALITGATAGSIGCLAAQGGLLAPLLVPPTAGGIDRGPGHAARTIGLFLLAKMVAHALFGAALGAFGTVLVQTPTVQAWLMIAVALIMVLNGLRMLELHPLFRRFALGPPAPVRRLFRRWLPQADSPTAPLILGVLTLLLPCGVAQAMMAAALASGSVLQGAGTLLAFTVGGAPLFFVAVFLAARLNAGLLRRSTPLAALVLIGLALIPLNQGLTVLGSPLSFSRLRARFRPAPQAVPAAVQAATTATVRVTSEGYAPDVLHLPAGREVVLNWVTEGTDTCARAVVIRGLNRELDLPAAGSVPLVVPPQAAGTVIHYSCSMGMYEGRLEFH